jgi:transposase
MARKRTYSRAFKIQALELVKSGQKSINEIERDLGITPGLLHKWKARMKADGPQAFPGKGHGDEAEAVIRQLKRENEVLRQERDILKKALAIFSSTEKSTSL